MLTRLKKKKIQRRVANDIKRGYVLFIKHDHVTNFVIYYNTPHLYFLTPSHVHSLSLGKG